MDADTIVREPMFNETNDFTARLYGFFVAPYDGPFRFYVASSDQVSLYFSNTSSPNDAMLIVENCEGKYKLISRKICFNFFSNDIFLKEPLT